MAALKYKLKSDILFKMLFATHEPLLRSLVAASLGWAQGALIRLKRAACFLGQPFSIGLGSFG